MSNMRTLKQFLLTPAHLNQQNLWFFMQCAMWTAKDLLAVLQNIKRYGTSIEVTNSILLKAMAHEQDKGHINITILRASSKLF